MRPSLVAERARGPAGPRFEPNAPAAPRRARAGHRVRPSPDVLFEVLDPGVNAAVWRRPLAPALAAGLSPLLKRVGVAFDGAVSARHPEVDRLVAALPPSPSRAALADDVRDLIARFAAVSGAARPHAHLEAVDDDGCRKFHVDYVGLRLLTTYVGPGTEWLSEDAVDRAALAPSDAPPDETNAAVVRDPALVRRARAGDVLLLKGEGWPGNEGRGAVHRSPPVAATGARRLVFKLTALAHDLAPPGGGRGGG
ncbi:MAG TPA: DUF1826 domain-containing protein [Polyangiaceae bacterium]|nr:DUF1826 domain-containing protein [Polyangiaceae bacterium]